MAQDALRENRRHSSIRQYCIPNSIRKCIISTPVGKTMILRFAAETEIDTSYAA